MNRRNFFNRLAAAFVALKAKPVFWLGPPKPFTITARGTISTSASSTLSATYQSKTVWYKAMTGKEIDMARTGILNTVYGATPNRTARIDGIA